MCVYSAATYSARGLGKCNVIKRDSNLINPAGAGSAGEKSS